MSHKPSTIPELAAALLTLLVVGGCLAYELRFTFQHLQMTLGQLPKEALLDLLLKACLRASFLAKLIFIYPVFYVPLALLDNTGFMASSSPLKGGSYAQTELNES